MSKFEFKKAFILGLAGVSIFSATLSARIPETATNSVDECSKDLLLAFFPKVFVNETLKKYNVPEDQWEAINQELSKKDKDVIKTVEQKAEKISPNLLKDPQKRQIAVKLFRETLFESFSTVMKAHGITDDAQIQTMLDDIQKQKETRFAECMQKHQVSSQDNIQKTDEDDDDEDKEGQG